MVQPEYEIRYDITGRPVYLPKQAPAQQDVTSVNGRAGAEAYAMGANSKALLLDATAPILWLKVTDGAGYATIDGYDLTPHVEPTPESEAKTMVEALDARLRKIENLMEVIANGRESAAAETRGTLGE